MIRFAALICGFTLGLFTTALGQQEYEWTPREGIVTLTCTNGYSLDLTTEPGGAVEVDMDADEPSTFSLSFVAIIGLSSTHQGLSPWLSRCDGNGDNFQFVSVSTKFADDHGTVTGDLTANGITRSVDFAIQRVRDEDLRDDVLQFALQATVDRSDFDLHPPKKITPLHCSESITIDVTCWVTQADDESH